MHEYNDVYTLWFSFTVIKGECPVITYFINIWRSVKIIFLLLYYYGVLERFLYKSHQFSVPSSSLNSNTAPGRLSRSKDFPEQKSSFPTFLPDEEFGSNRFRKVKLGGSSRRTPHPSVPGGMGNREVGEFFSVPNGS